VSSSSDRLVRRVSIAASAGLALMLAATVVYVAWPRVAAAFGSKPAPVTVPPAYAAGQSIDAPAAWYADAPRTLVLFARASCAACEKAQPFLKQLVAAMAGQGGAVMAHPPGAEADDRRFAKSLGIGDGDVFVTPAGLRVRATPTIVLVDRQGRILDAWEGAGTPERQAEILKSVTAALR